MPINDRSVARRVDLTTLQLFVAVCELGSIGKAAEREFIAASAVSKRLSELESQLGAELLQRHSRGVSATAAGHSLLHHARSILRSLEQMQAELAEYAHGVRGHVRMFANISAIVQFLPEGLGAFARAHEHIKIDLQERLSVDVVRGLTEGSCDLGVCDRAVGVGDLATLPYKSDTLMLVCHQRHALAQANPLRQAIGFEAALEHDQVGLHTSSAIHMAVLRAAANAGKPVRLRMQVTGLDAMCRMIHNGLGVGLIPSHAFALMPHMQDLVTLPLTDTWATRHIDLVARDFHTLPTSAKLLVAHLTQNHTFTPPSHHQSQRHDHR